MKLKFFDKKEDITLIIISGILLTYMLTIAILSISLNNLNSKVIGLQGNLIELESSQVQIEDGFVNILENEHFALLEKQKFSNELELLRSQLGEKEEEIETITYEETLKLIDDYQTKVERNQKVKLDVDDQESTLNGWGNLLLGNNLDELVAQIETINQELDKKYDEYLATLPPPPTAGGGYSFSNVPTERGTFGVYLIKLPLNEYSVKTVSASKSDCKDNCPTKSLGEYVQENGGVAGMNGSYFCPPDYPACGGKVNSFDYAFYDSNAKKWLNKDAREWFDTGMITFKGSTANFYKKTSEYGGDSIDAAISNYPSLLKNGEVDIKTSTLSSYQKDVKGVRGVIGVGGENIYLAHITGATVTDAAYVMKALGAKHALNLDGGGSSALYINGGYIIGPGRGLPNAIVLVKR